MSAGVKCAAGEMASSRALPRRAAPQQAAVRAFIALALEESALGEAARCLARLRSGPLAADARFVRPEGLHVTLRFLGAIAAGVVGALADAVASETRAVAPFAVRLGDLHGFPSVRRPRVLALGVEPEQKLAALASAVERGVVAAGFAAEPRPFRPHVTLARVREGGRPAVDTALRPSPAAFTAREVILFESRPGPGGSVYTPLERMALGGPAFTQP